MKLVTKVVLQNGNISYPPVNAELTEGSTENKVINVHQIGRQNVFGFGGAITDSAAYNYALMSDANKKMTLEYLYGKSGLKYNFMRLCIGSCDFSVDEYSYVREGDMSLDTFSLDRDRKYVIPFVKDVLAFTGGNIKIFASPWSPPAYMKDNNSLIRGGKLKKEYYELYAKYLIKFIAEYRKEGIDIFALTMQNEPKASQTWESCIFSAEEETEFAHCLTNAIKESGLDIKIICWDHNKERLYERASFVFDNAGDEVWGAGFHWYSGLHAAEIRLLREQYPDKAIIDTEFCVGLGSREYNKYHNDVIVNLDAGANAIVEWNVLLNEIGGPFHNRSSGCNAPLLYDTQNETINVREIYWSSYIFSHYIEPNATVLASSSFSADVDSLAVKNGDGHLLLYVNNRSSQNFDVTVRIKEKEMVTELPSEGIVLLEFDE